MANMISKRSIRRAAREMFPGKKNINEEGINTISSKINDITTTMIKEAKASAKSEGKEIITKEHAEKAWKNMVEQQYPEVVEKTCNTIISKIEEYKKWLKEN